MASEYEEQLFELLSDAADWPEAERRQRAEDVCADGPVAARDLLVALDRERQLGGYLESPAWLGDDGTPGLAELVVDEEPSWRCGQRLGHYQLKELLGEGGMGQVFLAEQDEPFRQVALKLIRPTAVTAGTLERFRAEQRALARLNHPHVAQLYEVDVTENQQPYFVMEWVEGQPIDEFLTRRPPDLDERLHIFHDVCSAVRHAHQRQVVHRDLKPSNILVREAEGRLIPKVIDFGIAEALDRPLDGDRIFKEGGKEGGIYGTPEYLSPESFDGNVDTRADVYALGVLLYELVTGARPFRPEGSQVSDLVERIRRGDARPPSLAVVDSSLPFADPSARTRWARRVRGDLDAVVQRAMHPDPEARYSTVAGLIADLDRFLQHEPVAARPSGLGHQSRLLLRRRRGTVVATAIVLMSIIAGSVAATYGLLKARQEAEATRVALAEAEELARFLTDLFQESDPNQTQGAELTAREILEQGAERLRNALLDQPMARARLTRTIGGIYARLGHYEQAEPLLDESLALVQDHHGEAHPEVAQALHALAVMKTKADELDAAEGLFEQALAIQDSHPDSEPAQQALSAYHLGVLAYRGKDYRRAEGLFDRACGTPEAAELDAELRARCFEAYGALQLAQSRLDEAQQLFESSLRLREQVLGPNHPHVANSLESLCQLHNRQRQLELAVPYCERAMAIWRQAFGSGRHSDVTRTLERLANLYRQQQRYDEAEASFQEVLDVYSNQPHPSPRRLASLTIRTAWIAWLQGRYPVAEQRYRRAQTILEPTPDAETYTADIARLGIGLCHWKLGQFEQAERQLLPIHDDFSERYGAGSTQIAWTAWGLAGVYRDRRDATRDDLQRAGELYRQAVDARRHHYAPDNEYLRLTESDYRQYLALVGPEEAADRGEG